uniref:Uncharacterized protein n=1 Tax=Globodera pallida TaxID=36090 RepID=A0A183CLK3_GLOPA
MLNSFYFLMQLKRTNFLVINAQIEIQYNENAKNVANEELFKFSMAAPRRPTTQLGHVQHLQANAPLSL